MHTTTERKSSPDLPVPILGLDVVDESLGVFMRVVVVAVGVVVYY